MSSLDADIVVLGGGCAGLSLAARLAEAEAVGARIPRVLVLEPRDAYADDRTWSFWRVRPHDFSDEVEARWWRWRVSAGDRTHVAGSARYPYESVSAAAFYRRCLTRIEASRAVNLRLGQGASAVREDGDAVIIDTPVGRLRAGLVVDTRPAARESGAPPPLLFQVFRGVRVRCDDARFEPATVGLMQDMASDAYGFRFTYVLPYAEDEALVEATRFAPALPPSEVLQADLDRALQRLGVDRSAHVVRSERGVIPMGMAAARPTWRVVPAGTRGGAVRAASGYAFLRIDAWARQAAGQIARGHPPPPQPAEPWTRAAMDRLFLATLAREPALAPRAFLALGHPRMSERLVRFLSDAASPADALSIITALPSLPFLRSLLAEIVPLPRSSANPARRGATP